jgi:hypothetical protein
MVTQNDLQPGDLLLFKVKPASSILSKLIGWGQKVLGHAPTKAEYCHVALVAFDPTYLMEARWPKTRIWKIDWPTLNESYDIQLFRVKNTTTRQLLDAIHWAEDHLNEWYDVLELLDGWIAIKHTYICSTFVCEAWEAAGVDFRTGINDFVTPDEIAASNLIWRVK